VLYVSTTHAGPCDLLDAQGRVVKRLALRAGDNVVPVQELADGVYLLRALTADGSTSCRRVMVR
jgi:hypothetical protein